MFPVHNGPCGGSECEHCREISEKVQRTALAKRTQPNLTDDSSVDQKKLRFHSMLSSMCSEVKCCLDVFDTWTEDQQLSFLCSLVHKMRQTQHSTVYGMLQLLLQRDFVVSFLNCGVPELAIRILSELDAESLLTVELVSTQWRSTIIRYQLWRRLVTKTIQNNKMWDQLSQRFNWKYIISCTDPLEFINLLEKRRDEYKLKNPQMSDFQNHFFNLNEYKELLKNAGINSLDSCDPEDIRALNEYYFLTHKVFKKLYSKFSKDIKRIEENWINGSYSLTRISCKSNVTKGVYCLQYDNDKIVSGLRDNTIRIWKKVNNQSSEARDVLNGNGGFECTDVLSGHDGSVLCLQYEGNLLISGSSDSTVRLWNLETGECTYKLCYHAEAVLHIRFKNNILVTCSKDRTIAVWEMDKDQTKVTLKKTLMGHKAAVNVVDFDEKYIVSASGDRTIKVWFTDQCTYVRSLVGHRRGIACLQYRDNLVVSGSSDNTIRIWEISTGVCFRVLEGHEDLVRCIRFDSKKIISGSYDGIIKVWDLKAALDQKVNPEKLCIRTLHQHTGRVFRLQFDDFQIVSSSHDDTILVWDFTENTIGSNDRDDGFDDGTVRPNDIAAN